MCENRGFGCPFGFPLSLAEMEAGPSLQSSACPKPSTALEKKAPVLLASDVRKVEKATQGPPDPNKPHENNREHLFS